MTRWLLGGEPGPAGALLWTTPSWVVALAVAAAVAALLAASRGKGLLPLRVGELALWALALAATVVGVAGPVWLEEEGREEPGRVAVLVDASRSMSVVEGGRPRSDAARAVLSRIEGSDVDVYHFGGELAAGPPGAFDLPHTDVEAALEALSDRVAGESLAGVVLISDGIDRGLLRKRFQSEGDAEPPRLPGPLTVYAVGEATQLKDLSVRYVDAGGYAYVRAPFQIRASILGVGFEGRKLRADLLRDGSVVTSTDVTLDEAGEGEAVFELNPERPGRYTYVVQVPEYEGDAVPGNNAMPVVVRVVRDRIRVLQVAGAPSWDVKFLRRFLKGDPSVDLVSFFILRTSEDRLSPRYADNELALIAFPYEQLFTTDLWTFDLVIFQNFDHRPYFQGMSRTLLGNIARHVDEGGHGLVMIGGDRSFELGAYADTPLADVLPVRMASGRPDPSEEPFVPSLTEAGARHPVTRLTSDPTENQAWWSRLHPLDGTNRILGATPDASVLLTHPTLKGDDGAPLPVVSVREVGAGRTMAFTADTSWRWSLSEAAQGRGNQAYLRFWKGAMRWLIGDPTAERVNVDSSRENYTLGDEVRVSVTARDRDFQLLPGADVELIVTGASGDQSLRAETGAEGEARFSWTAEERGAFTLRARVRSGGASVGEAQTVFAVTSRDPELEDVVPDHAFLAWLASRSGGRFYAVGDAGPALRDPGAGRTVYDRRELPLWRAPGLALLIGLSAGLAWILRRRSGLR